MFAAQQMKLSVKVRVRAKEARVEKVDDTHYRVCVKAPPVDGKANEAVREALARYFDVRRSAVRIVSGSTSRQKLVEIS